MSPTALSPQAGEHAKTNILAYMAATPYTWSATCTDRSVAEPRALPRLAAPDSDPRPRPHLESKGGRQRVAITFDDNDDMSDARPSRSTLRVSDAHSRHAAANTPGVHVQMGHQAGHRSGGAGGAGGAGSICYRVPYRPLFLLLRPMHELIGIKIRPGLPIEFTSSQPRDAKVKLSAVETRMFVFARPCTFAPRLWRPVHMSGTYVDGSNDPHDIIPNNDLLERDDWRYSLPPPSPKDSTLKNRYPRVTIDMAAQCPFWAVRRRLVANIAPHLCESYWVRHSLKAGDIRFAIESLSPRNIWRACIVRRIPLPQNSVKPAFGALTVSPGNPCRASVALIQHTEATFFSGKKRSHNSSALYCDLKHTPFLPVELVSDAFFGELAAAAMRADWTSYADVQVLRLFRYKGMDIVPHHMGESGLIFVWRVVPSAHFPVFYDLPKCLLTEPPQVVLPDRAKYAATKWAFHIGRLSVHSDNDGYGIGEQFKHVMQERRSKIQTKVTNKTNKQTSRNAAS